MSQHHQARWGLFQICLAGVLWGTGGLGVQLIREHEPMSVVTISAWRMLLAAVVLVAAVLVLRQSGAVRALLRAHPGRAVVVGTGTALYQAFYFGSVVAVGVTVSTVVSLGLAPVLLTVAEAVRHRRRPGSTRLLVLAAALGGLLLVSVTSGSGETGPHPVPGVLLALGSGTAYAVATELGRPLAQVSGPLALTTTTTSVGTLFLLPFGLLAGIGGDRLVTIDPAAVTGLVYLGVMTMALAYGLLVRRPAHHPRELGGDRNAARAGDRGHRGRGRARRAARRVGRRRDPADPGRRGRPRRRGGAGLGAAAGVTFDPSAVPHCVEHRDTSQHAGLRLACAVLLAAGLIVGAVALPSYAKDHRQGTLQSKMDVRKKRTLEAQAARRPARHPAAQPQRPADQEPRLPRRRDRCRGARPEHLPDPRPWPGGRRGRAEDAGPEADQGARHAEADQDRPPDRYAMANGCYELGGTRGLLQAHRPRAVPALHAPTGASRRRRHRGRARATRRCGRRASGGAGSPSPTPASPGVRGKHTFRLRRATGCTAYPEAGIDISGRPHGGVTPYQEVRGYVDAHTHGMAFEFLGGDAHCGRPWRPVRAPYALVDCPDHTVTGGYGGVLEEVLSGEPHHDPVGWPTFKDWPAPDSLTHEGTYYRWLERSWRGGQRIFVNLLVENNQLCMLYPLKRNSCDDMDSIRLQAKRHVPDAGLHRRAVRRARARASTGSSRNPFQARKVINAGKMAVVMGIETSRAVRLHVEARHADLLDRRHRPAARRGAQARRPPDGAGQQVRQRAGRRGRRHRRGRRAVNAANFLETGSFWDMRHCEPADGECHDNNQLAAPDISAGQQDALFGAIAALGLPSLSRCRSTRRRTTATARPDHARRAHDQGPGRAAHDLRPRPHEREGPAAALDRSTSSATTAWCLATRGPPPTPTRGSTAGRLHHAVRRRLDRLRRQVAPPRRLGGPALLLRASATAPT